MAVVTLLGHLQCYLGHSNQLGKCYNEIKRLNIKISLDFTGSDILHRTFRARLCTCISQIILGAPFGAGALNRANTVYGI